MDPAVAVVQKHPRNALGVSAVPSAGLRLVCREVV